MTTPHPLEAFTGPLATHVGAFFAGERAVFRGQDLHRDLGDASWMDLYVFGITGRRYDEKALRVLNAIWSYTSYPDTRLWNNRVAALGGTMRSTGNLAVSAALAISEAAIFGRQIDLMAMDFLLRAKAVDDKNKPLSAFVENELRVKRVIPGYGRPLINGDERLAPMRALLLETGLLDGPHQQLAMKIESILLGGRWRFKMNAAALGASIAADLGFSPREYYAFQLPAFLAGMQPCYTEAVAKPPASIMPIACSSVGYKGPPPRLWA